MKRTTAILLLLAILLTSHLSLTGYASPAEDEAETATDALDQSATTPVTGGTATDIPTPVPTDPGDTAPPISTQPDSEATEPTVPETTPPPVTDEIPSTDEIPTTGEIPDTSEPPITNPPVTEPPETEPIPSDEDLLYKALSAVIDAGETALEFSTVEKLSDELVRIVCTRALEQTPRFFYLGAIDISVTPLPEPDEAGNLYTYRMIPEYRFAPGEELDAAKAYVDDEVAKIIAQIPKHTSDAEKLLFLHDYLCTHFAYDGTHTVGDLYNLLQNGHGVCQAYVYLYAHLLDQLAIPNDFAVSKEMNHIWNVVKLDGKWYHIDLTWDDPTVDQAGRALHTNFLRSDKGIAETGHHSWSASYICDSDLYETSFLPDLTGTVLFTPYGTYGISQSQRTLMKLDFDIFTATPVADLSPLRWRVWNKPDSLWKEQYINLYSDGHLIYFNGPDTIWSFDPELELLELLFTFDPYGGYLYSLSGDGHTLTCTVSTAPGKADRTVRFTTPHIYTSEGDVLFSTETCVICDHSETILSPLYGSFFTACLSTRPNDESRHDLRLILLINQEMLLRSPALTVRLTLHSSGGDRSVTTTISSEEHGLFLDYERIHAGGREYSAAYGYEMLGLIIRGLDNGSYDSIFVTVTEGDTVIYNSTLSAESLFPAPEEPPMTVEPPVTAEPPISSDQPALDESESESESDNTDIDTESDPSGSTETPPPVENGGDSASDAASFPTP